MLKNMKMGIKLVLIGTLLIFVPLALMCVVAITRATSGWAVATMSGSTERLSAAYDGLLSEA
jgi:hypothetical protein